MFGYRVPAPDEAMLISGGRRGLGGAPFRVVTGHGKFVLPVFRKTRFLTLAMCEAEVSEKCVTRQGIALTVKAVIAFKVGNDHESIVNAGQRFLSDQDQMAILTGRIFAGHLRSIIGSMTVEEIVTERQKLATEVLETSKSEMAKIGLTVDSLQIQSIDDGDTGYIDAMSAPHKAAIQRQAQIAQAQATQASVEAQQAAARNQAEYARQTAIVQAEYNAEVDRAQAQAAQAGPLAQANAQREVLAAQTELALRAAELRQQQLVAEIVKPAEAEAERIRVLAVAEAERMRIQAAAAASHDRVALERMLIDQLPQIVKEASAGLAGANVNVLNGADGLSEIAAGLVSQGLTILDSVRKNLNGEDGRGDATGSSAAVALRGIVTGERRGGARNGEGGAGKGGPADGPVDID
ncbi:SPFH domain-containing protein [Actinacidiphila sp. DG2A-62]|uniref:SPFH domain-containing protein n=1 Tax=Actinacidiphila sp. DG2A-62 TaxID=3108821 RepID=UPI002DBADAB1|nr:SPFH domain-containing protein [Actinacidiphila sp. DG2A-62]MEC3992201.1 SPFH domain-containing protein [Actinacidiphila sp. DG2A-62]